jgi:hypothetical protein
MFFPSRQYLEAILANQAKMAATLAVITTNMEKIMTGLTDLQTAVANEETVEAGVVTLLQQLSADLAAALANNDNAALEALVTQINTDAASMAAAVTANTPAAPPASAKRR